MDNQLPPIIIGALLILPVAGNAPPAGALSDLPPPAVYVLVVLGLACFSWGMYLNAESLKYPESPFNKHTSPWLLAVIVIGCLGFSAWETFGGLYGELAYVFGAGIIAAVAATLRAVTRSTGKPSGGGLS